MLINYLILNVPIHASDQEIRDKYLHLVKKFTPEKDPEQFRKITEAYESLKDRQNRVKQQIFGYREIQSENGLFDLAEAVKPVRKRVTLKELIHEVV